MKKIIFLFGIIGFWIFLYMMLFLINQDNSFLMVSGTSINSSFSSGISGNTSTVSDSGVAATGLSAWGVLFGMLFNTLPSFNQVWFVGFLVTAFNWVLIIVAILLVYNIIWFGDGS